MIKRRAAPRELLRHRGPAIVFEDIHDLAARVDDPELEIDGDSVMVLQNAGPVGAPGMPEWGQLPIPPKLPARGVADMVRISDARMSGTAFGSIVLHVAPESAAGGPLLVLVRTGDPIELDVDGEDAGARLSRRAEARQRRHAEWSPPPAKYTRGYGALYRRAHPAGRRGLRL